MLKSLKSGEQQAVELNAEALQAALAAMRS
jgi:hypothetical protein